jgi:hypothetical protein
VSFNSPLQRCAPTSKAAAHFSGSPRAWSNTTPSAPARAINQMRIANPILMLDEIERQVRRRTTLDFGTPYCRYWSARLQ